MNDWGGDNPPPVASGGMTDMFTRNAFAPVSATARHATHHVYHLTPTEPTAHEHMMATPPVPTAKYRMADSAFIPPWATPKTATADGVPELIDDSAFGQPVATDLKTGGWKPPPSHPSIDRHALPAGGTLEAKSTEGHAHIHSDMDLAIVAASAYEQDRESYMTSKTESKGRMTYLPNQSNGELAMWMSGDGKLYVGMRGSVTSADWFKTDVGILRGDLVGTDRYQRNKATIADACRVLGVSASKVVLSGHSLGGSLALTLAAEMGYRGVGFNAGVSPFTNNKHGFDMRREGLVNYIVEGDPIAMGGTMQHWAHTYIIPRTAQGVTYKGIVQQYASQYGFLAGGPDHAGADFIPGLEYLDPSSENYAMRAGELLSNRAAAHKMSNFLDFIEAHRGDRKDLYAPVGGDWSDEGHVDTGMTLDRRADAYEQYMLSHKQSSTNWLVKIVGPMGHLAHEELGKFENAVKGAMKEKMKNFFLDAVGGALEDATGFGFRQVLEMGIVNYLNTYLAGAFELEAGTVSGAMWNAFRGALANGEEAAVGAFRAMFNEAAAAAEGVEAAGEAAGEALGAAMGSVFSNMGEALASVEETLGEAAAESFQALANTATDVAEIGEYLAEAGVAMGEAEAATLAGMSTEEALLFAAELLIAV